MRARRLVLSTAAALICAAGSARAAGDPIMPLSQVHAGMDCTGETVVQGTTISSFNVHVIDIVQDPVEGARILVSVSGPAVDQTGIAEGFSGSPVYCSDGITSRVIGAISETIGQYGNNVGLVTPIEQMLGEPVTPPAGAPRLRARARPLLGPLTIGGLSPAVMSLLQAAAHKAGRLVVAEPAGSAAADFPLQDLVPGASVAASYSSGGVPIGAVGTVTYRDGQTVYAFGHELDGAGRRSLLLQDAYVYYVVSNPGAGFGSSYKLASPGHTVGTLTSDTPNAIIGRLGSTPPTIPLDVTAHDLDTGATQTLDTQVADETDAGMPLGSSLLELVAPLAVSQAATRIFNGAPANESGRMCLSVTLREAPQPLQFCNRYVGTGPAGDLSGAPPEVGMAASLDISSALGLIDAVQFAALHVTAVNAQLDVQRGLDEATIVSARAPRRVRAGKVVRVQLRIQQYRGPLLTVTFPIRIPRNAHGRVIATIANAETAGAAGSTPQGSLQQALTQALAGPGPSTPPGAAPPSSIAQLRQRFAQTAVYDGLEVSFKGHKPVNVYRDPRLVINGQARLTFRVSR